MTKKAIISSVELKRMADVANSENVTIELERDGAILRVMPYRQHQVRREKMSREEEAEAGLAQWLADKKRQR
ncbi:hypothetical protein [Ensifer canadensis]